MVLTKELSIYIGWFKITVIKGGCLNCTRLSLDGPVVVQLVVFFSSAAHYSVIFTGCNVG